MQSKHMEKYFENIKNRVLKEYKVANDSRKKGYDPEDKVNTPLAENMIERVEGLMSAVAPQLIGSGASERMFELEKEYGVSDWRVSLIIAEEIARQKFCKFEDDKEAIEVGIRTGFAYHTQGIVAAPLEGFIGIEIKKTNDGKDFFSIKFAGPIRGAGGTGASVCVLIADYVRKKLGYAKYDPNEKEVNRYVTELVDYDERVTNLQYRPSNDEIKFLAERLPVEVAGDPSEKFDVSNYKDLPRVETNKIRGGMCLVFSMIALKAPKLWKRLEKWGEDFDMDWMWIGDFIKLQKKKKSGGGDSEDKPKLTPNKTFIADLVAGRPVLTFPMEFGGFRLRYGRCRTSGFSASAIHPATMHLINDYIAVGTQLKLERPGKAASMTVCDYIQGPIVKLKDGSVEYVDDEEHAKKIKNDIECILFLGDILLNYGDFSENGHSLIPSGYCEEWWAKHLEKSIVNLFGNIDLDKAVSLVNSSSEELKKILKNPQKNIPSASLAIQIAKKFEIPLHPHYTYYWKGLLKEDLLNLYDKLESADIENDKVVIKNSEIKEVFERIGCPHKLVNKEFIVIENAKPLLVSLGLEKLNVEEALKKIEKEDVLEILNNISSVKIMDKAGTFIGARMGRPEKAKMRVLKGKPHGLFPVGDEGDRLRCFQSALKKGKITSSFSTYNCKHCKKETIYRICEICGKKTIKTYHCKMCGTSDKEECEHGEKYSHKRLSIDINHYFGAALKMLKTRVYPDLIKGVRGTSNKDHIPEHLVKGILRAKHDIHVNKDGSVRYDMTELPITHFTPFEVETSVEKLKELGYDKDIYDKELKSPNQILELKPQDIILPSCTESPEEGAPEILLRVAKFIDDLLINLYKQKPYYNVNKREDLIGQLVLGLAPHISAAMIGRIIGFSKTSGCYAHPLWHAALRRDCFSYDTFIPVCKNGVWKIEKIGELVEKLNPVDVVDNFGTKEIKVSGYRTFAEEKIKINNFTKHAPQNMIQIKTKFGRILKTTINHKHIVNGKKIVKSKNLKIGDCLSIPYKIKVPKKDIKKLNLISIFSDKDWVMVNGLNNQINIVKYAKKYFLKSDNYIKRDSYPVSFVNHLIKKKVINEKHIQNLFVSAKRNHVKIPAIINVDKTFLNLLGLYVAKGYSRKTSRLYQVYISAQKDEIRKFIIEGFEKTFKLKKTENKKDRITFSSRILYSLFTEYLEMGSSAYEKRMPFKFLNLPDKKLGYLLQGYFEGDGSVSKSDNRVTFDTVSEGLLRDLDFIAGQFGIFIKNYTYTSFPGKIVRDFYLRKNREVPKFKVTKGIIQSFFVKKFYEKAGFISKTKNKILRYLSNKKPILKHEDFVYDKIVSIEFLEPEVSYCLNTENHKVTANSILTKQCDGDECSVSLLLDSLLNFSRQYLPDRIGSRTMDAPLVLTAKLNPSEVDDMVHGMDVVWDYPLEFYKAANEYKKPWEIDIEQLGKRLNTWKQYEKIGFTQHTSNINNGVLCSAYKTLPSMREKLDGQMQIAEKIKAVDQQKVAKLVIEKHFMKDIKGNLRKFSMQQFRCVKCNEKFRRPPLAGKCKCGGKILFTISEGSVIKYLGPAMLLAKNYKLDAYLTQTLDLTQKRIEEVFGKEKEKQEGLSKWF